MSEVVRLLGVEKRQYTDKSTGELKSYCGLHVVYELEEEAITAGKRVDSFSCPKEVNPDDLVINQCYELDWSHFHTKAGTGAKISGLMPVEG